MAETLNILNIDTDCTDNGIGLRTVIYIAGCKHHCPFCHNQSSWSPNNGVEMSIDEIIAAIEQNAISDVTISGGDGLTYQYKNTLKLLKEIKARTNKNVWLYTGYTFEELLEQKRECLDYIDVLVDGRFEIDKRDLNLRFKGSLNQRIVDVKTSLIMNKLILWNEG